MPRFARSRTTRRPVTSKPRMRMRRRERQHRLLIADDVAQEVALVLFSDTRRTPAAVPSRIQPAEALGPRELLARVRWLAQPVAEAWVPTAAEVNARYQDFL